jgi:replicative DNA helicase
VPSNDHVPSNAEAEEAVLGSLLMDPSAIVRVAASLSPSDFFRPSHSRIYAAVLGLYNRQQAIDVLTVASQLEKDSYLHEIGGAPFLTDLIARTPVSVHVEHYAALVIRDSIRRSLIDAAGEIAKIAYEDRAAAIQQTVDAAETVLFRVLRERLRNDLVPISDILDDYYEQIEEIQANRDLQLGIPTDFEDLDRLLGRLQPSDMVVVAGRPGMGKTSWLLSVAQNVAMRHGKTVAIFSLEMSALQLVQRLIASETGVSTHRLRLGEIRSDEMELVSRAIGTLESLPIYIDDTPGVSPMELRTKARRLHAERGVDVIIVDYLQLMHSGDRSENRVQEISFISRALKGLARELGVPVIAASQLSRAVESRADRRPQLSDLRESGSIEQDSDIVLFLYRESVYNDAAERPNITELHVAKHRHGPTGTVELVFIAERTRFESAALETVTIGEFA